MLVYLIGCLIAAISCIFFIYYHGECTIEILFYSFLYCVGSWISVVCIIVILIMFLVDNRDKVIWKRKN